MTYLHFPFDPDYVVPTSEVLREWLDSRHLSPSVAAVVASHGRGTPSHKAAREHLEMVLDDMPFTTNTADLLAVVTGISAPFWLSFEHNYRKGLAAGKTVS